jgi:hypothetical protein
MAYLFHIGMKVICIDGNFKTRVHKENYPTEGFIYTIRDIVEAQNNGIAFLLEEIINKPCFHILNGIRIKVETPFKSERFKPVKETSIDCFKSMLGPQGDGDNDIETTPKVPEKIKPIKILEDA